MGLYVAGHRSSRRHPGRVLFEVLVVLAVLALIGFMGKRFLSPDTSLGNTPPVTTVKVLSEVQGKKHVDQGLFSLELPDDWRPTASPDQPYKIYSWHNTTQNEGVRRLDVYVDGAPRMPVNRVLPIQASGIKLIPLGQVSDNCITFTEGAKNTSGSSLPGKWRRVNFLCDTANYVRDVVGTSSPDGVDIVKVANAKSGSHSFFFVYTDNSAVPDYDVFTNIITDFRLK